MPIIGALIGFFLLSSAAVALPAQADAPTVPPLPHYSVTLTGYNAVPEQTDDTPFETASGLYSNPETVAARSQDFASDLPFGTIVQVDGSSASGEYCNYAAASPFVGYRIIADTMNSRFSKRIDILFGTKTNYTHADGSSENVSIALGLCKHVTIRVVGFIDLNKTSRVPKTQEELTAWVKKINTLAVK